MSACEKCWADASARAAYSDKSVVEEYHALLRERADDPCDGQTELMPDPRTTTEVPF